MGRGGVEERGWSVQTSVFGAGPGGRRGLGQVLGQFGHWKFPYRGCTDTGKTHINPDFILVFPTFRLWVAKPPSALRSR